MDADTIPVSKNDVEFNVTIGNDTTKTTANIQYPDYVVNEKNSIGSAFTETVSHVGNKENPGYYKTNDLCKSIGKFFNKCQTKSSSLPLKLSLIISGQINKEVTDIKNISSSKGYTLNKGYDVNTKELTDVTNQYLQNYIWRQQ